MTASAEIDTLLATASNAITAMRSATAGKQDEDSANTDVSTLLALTRLLDGLTAELAQRRRREAEMVGLLDRVATLKVRGGAELIEQGAWKKLCGELQDIALHALKIVSQDR